MGFLRGTRVVATTAVLVSGMVIVGAGASVADSPCLGLTSAFEGNYFDTRRQDSGSPTLIRGDLRAYNPWVIDQGGETGASAAWVMLTRKRNYSSDPRFWVQTGWVKSPRASSPNKFNPLVFMQLQHEEYNTVHRWKDGTTGGTIVWPPYSHRYQVKTNRDTGANKWWVYFVDTNTAWKSVDSGDPKGYWLPNQMQTGGETIQGGGDFREGDQLPGDLNSKMKFRNLRYANHTGTLQTMNLLQYTPAEPWFEYYTHDGSNFDIWDERCPN